MRIAVKFLCIVAVAGLASAQPQASDLAGPVRAVVMRAVDGDTLAVRARIWLDQWVETRVRLRGVDAPELHGKCAGERAAAARAREWLGQAAGGEVVLSDIGRDKYAGRVLASVSDEAGRDLSAGLLAAGLARGYDGGKRAGWCDGD